MIKSKGAQAYKKQITRGVEGSTPEELVGTLLVHLLETLAQAKQFMVMKQFSDKAHRINHAIDTLTVLEESLDYDNGGELVGNLQMLFQYSTRQLLQAHNNNDATDIDEIMSLMRNLKEGWEKRLASQSASAHDNKKPAADA